MLISKLKAAQRYERSKAHACTPGESPEILLSILLKCILDSLALALEDKLGAATILRIL